MHGGGSIHASERDYQVTPPLEAGFQTVILGGGGHAAVVIDAMQAGGGRPHAVLDDNKDLWGRDLLGVPIIGGDDKLPDLIQQGVTHFIVGVGSVGNALPRRKLFETALLAGLSPINAIHPAAAIASSALVRDGAVVLANAVINPRAAVGANVIINTSATVEHDCVIADDTHISPGAVLAGGVVIGNSCHVGAGAIIREGIKIGDRAMVGAGAVVVGDVAADTTVVGVPAKKLKNAIKPK